MVGRVIAASSSHRRDKDKVEGMQGRSKMSQEEKNAIMRRVYFTKKPEEKLGDAFVMLGTSVRLQKAFHQRPDNYEETKSSCSCVSAEEPPEVDAPDAAEKNRYIEEYQISAHGKRWKPVCRYSLGFLNIESGWRKGTLWIVEHRIFDNFILLIICFNSVLIAGTQARHEYAYANRDENDFPSYTEDHPMNIFANQVDPYLLALFTIECVCKIISYGFWYGPSAYLGDYWNWLDFLVVLSGIASSASEGTGVDLDFLRVFRVMRPLRSLTVVPEMKRIVNTVIGSIEGMRDVGAMFLFLMTIFGILAIHFWSGVLYRECRELERPTFDAVNECWLYPLDPESEGRLCGGRYMCAPGGFCRSTERDTHEDFRPEFVIDGETVLAPWERKVDGQPQYEWCHGVQESVEVGDFNYGITQFNNLGMAIMVIFQCITMEGWVDVMYMLQDAYQDIFAAVVFVILIIIGSFFLLNVALAVVWDSFSKLSEDNEPDDDGKMEDDKKLTDEEKEKEKNAHEIKMLMEGAKAMQDAMEEAQHKLWCDCFIVQKAYEFAENELSVFNFQNIVMACIVLNVITMCLNQYPPPGPTMSTFLDYTNYIFTGVFLLEFLVLHVGYGPKKYWTTLVMAFDGLIVVVSIAELFMGGGGGGAVKALRGFRLLRVFKLAKKMVQFRILLKAMARTVMSMGHFTVVLFLMMFVFTLMGMTFFATSFRFDEDDDGFKKPMHPDTAPFCGEEGDTACVPRGNFDTFLWAFVTCFQILSGENWNAVMYDGMLATGSHAVIFFVLLVVVGQLVILNLFLAILMDNFEKCNRVARDEEKERADRQAAKNTHRKSRRNSDDLADDDEDGEKKKIVDTIDGVRAIGDHAMECKPSDSAKSPEGEPTEAPKEEAGAENLDGTPIKIPPVGDKAMECFDKAAWSENADARKVENAGVTGIMKDEPEANNSNDAAKTAKKKRKEEEEEKPEIKWPRDYSFLVFPKRSVVRIQCGVIVQSKIFDTTVLYLIYISSAAMAVDSPLHDPDSTIQKVLKVMNIIFTSVFTMEMFMKMVVCGCFFGKGEKKTVEDGEPGKDGIQHYKEVEEIPPAYWRTGWNILDGLVVIVSLMDLLPMPGEVRVFKTMRVLRALRPLRVISRNQNMKLVVNTLFLSIPELCNLLVVAFLFLLIFGLFSVAYFNGTFYRCTTVSGGDFEEIDLELRARYSYHTDFTEYTRFDDTLYADAIQWTCIDTNSSSSSYGALWAFPDNITDLSKINGTNDTIDLAIGSSCDAYLAQLQAVPGANAAFPPPAEGAILKLWHRITSDTPLCEVGCSQDDLDEDRPGSCPKPLFADDLPYLCDGQGLLEATSADGTALPGPMVPNPKTSFDVADWNGTGTDYPEWRASGTKWAMPCGDVMLPNAETPAEPIHVDGCKSRMCGHMDEDAGMTNYCEQKCSTFPTLFCLPELTGDGYQTKNTCDELHDDFDADECDECRDHCVAACLCDTYCAPYKNDAAACVEQGGMWVNRNQHFDWVGTAMLTLVEISTTEGWVDVMYWACDSTAPMHQPRLNQTPIWSLFFCTFIFVGSFFILNLCVGVIVDNFGRMKEAQESNTDEQDFSMMTKAQRAWVESQKSVNMNEEVLFSLTNLDELPPRRRQMFHLVSDPRFESFIMACILLNTCVMGIKHFPEPVPEPGQEVSEYEQAIKAIGYMFGTVFLLEAVFKMFALRWAYFTDGWNRFDLVCVVAWCFGIGVEIALPDVKLGSAMNAIRLFRIARLFRLLRFAKGLNQLFNAFLISIPKMMNVLRILVLLLFLFSVMGCHMFAKTHYYGPHDVHANFRLFPRAVLTLIRCMTGEGWNELMHSMKKDWTHFGRVGLPCVPEMSFDVTPWADLNDKCAIESPVMCGNGPQAVFLFIAYTCVMTFVILNLFVAVVLEGFDSSGESEENAILEKSVEVWKQIDLDHKMEVLDYEANEFIERVHHELRQERESKKGKGSAAPPIPLNMSTIIFGLMNPHQGKDGRLYVKFKDAVDGALRLNNAFNLAAKMEELREEGGKELTEAELFRDISKLILAEEADAPAIIQQLAARKMQQKFRSRKAAREVERKQLEAEAKRTNSAKKEEVNLDDLNRANTDGDDPKGLPLKEEPVPLLPGVIVEEAQEGNTPAKQPPLNQVPAAAG